MVTSLINGMKAISNEVGILSHTVRLPRMGTDPNLINFGIWACNTEPLDGESFEGRSGACNESWEGAILATLGETFERYAPVFYDEKEAVRSAYHDLAVNAPAPSEYALFHDEQYAYYQEKGWNFSRFTEDIVLDWFKCTDLTTGKESYAPGQFIYMPYRPDGTFITAGNSTGLASHTSYHKAILNALYECVERDSFVITWMNNLVPPKIRLDAELEAYLAETFPPHYEWNFFDVTYDLGVPAVFGMCFGTTEYGPFVAVGSAARGSMGEALRKVIQEIGQTTPYFRWLLGEREDWQPSEDYNDLMSFADHSIFYLKRPELWGVFDRWRQAPETRKVNVYETSQRSPQVQIKDILTVLKQKGYNALLRDITTPDIRQLGFYSIKMVIPQLIQMAGGYPFYFSGGRRLYEVPELMGYGKREFADLNTYPHPFP